MKDSKTIAETNRALALIRTEEKTAGEEAREETEKTSTNRIKINKGGSGVRMMAETETKGETGTKTSLQGATILGMASSEIGWTIMTETRTMI